MAVRLPPDVGVVAVGAHPGGGTADAAALASLLDELDPRVELVVLVEALPAPLDVVDRLLSALRESGGDGAVVVAPVAEAVKEVSGDLVVADVDRGSLVTATLPAVLGRRVAARAARYGSGDVVDLVVRDGGVVVGVTPSAVAGGERR